MKRHTPRINETVLLKSGEHSIIVGFALYQEEARAGVYQLDIPGDKTVTCTWDGQQWVDIDCVAQAKPIIQEVAMPAPGESQEKASPVVVEARPPVTPRCEPSPENLRDGPAVVLSGGGNTIEPTPHAADDSSEALDPSSGTRQPPAHPFAAACREDHRRRARNGRPGRRAKIIVGFSDSGYAKEVEQDRARPMGTRALHEQLDLARERYQKALSAEQDDDLIFSRFVTYTNLIGEVQRLDPDHYEGRALTCMVGRFHSSSASRGKYC